jgi:hypothetical protein
MSKSFAARSRAPEGSALVGERNTDDFSPREASMVTPSAGFALIIGGSASGRLPTRRAYVGPDLVATARLRFANGLALDDDNAIRSSVGSGTPGSRYAGFAGPVCCTAIRSGRRSTTDRRHLPLLCVFCLILGCDNRARQGGRATTAKRAADEPRHAPRAAPPPDRRRRRAAPCVTAT